MTRFVEGVDSIEVDLGEENPELFVERHDGSGVKLDLTVEEYEALESTFMLTDEVKDDATED